MTNIEETREKYLAYMTEMYSKKSFRHKPILKKYKMTDFVYRQLVKDRIITNVNGMTNWVGKKPDMKLVDRIRKIRSEMQSKRRVINSALTGDEAKAVKFLKSKGYKVFRPNIVFKEIL